MDKVSLVGSWWFWLGLVLALITAAGGFLYAFRSLARARVIEDTPTARIRSAQQGYVELKGRAHLLRGEVVSAPLTGSECCWYRFSIERRGDKGWTTLERGSSSFLFLLRDDESECVVDPAGAEVTPTDRSVWYGSERHPHPRRVARKPTRRGTLVRWAEILSRDISGGSRYRYREERIYPGDPLYALGLFKSLDEIDREQSRREIATDLLRQWKRDQAGLLTRYDRNGDGRIDTQEWALARQDATGRAAREYAQRQPQHQHLLADTGAPARPFILSTLPELELAHYFRIRALGALGLFFLAGGIATWLLVTG